MIELDWPYCGERRKEVRSNTLTPWQLELARSLRGGKETVYDKPKQVKVYEWDEKYGRNY